MPVRTQDHLTATAAIAAIGPAFRHEFLPSKTGTPAPAFSRLCENLYPIDEHSGFKLPSARTHVIRAKSTGPMALPHTVLRVPLTSLRFTKDDNNEALSALVFSAIAAQLKFFST